MSLKLQQHVHEYCYDAIGCDMTKMTWTKRRAASRWLSNSPGKVIDVNRWKVVLTRPKYWKFLLIVPCQLETWQERCMDGSEQDGHGMMWDECRQSCTTRIAWDEDHKQDGQGYPHTSAGLTHDMQMWSTRRDGMQRGDKYREREMNLIK